MRGMSVVYEVDNECLPIPLFHFFFVDFFKNKVQPGNSSGWYWMVSYCWGSKTDF